MAVPTSISNILGRCTNLMEYFSKSPDRFKFDKLDLHELVMLLQYDSETFGPLINLNQAPVYDRVSLYQHGDKKISSMIEFTAAEVRKMPESHYMILLRKNFKKYINGTKFDSLTKHSRGMILIDHPEWVVEHCVKTGIKVPTLSSQALTSAAESKPKFVATYIADVTELVTTDRFWLKMIKYDTAKYKPLFLQNTNTCSTKTDVRHVLKCHPGMIKDLTPDIMMSFKLSTKETIHLISQLMNLKKNEKIFKDWEYSSEMAEFFRVDLMSEILTGKSKLSRQLKKAMGCLESTADEEEITAAPDKVVECAED